MMRSICVLASLLALVAGNAPAQGFPERPLSLISPFSPNGTSDQYLHRFAPIAARYVGQSVIVERMPGDNGTRALAKMAATARPDGYTLSILPITAFRVPHMRRVSWDPINDFTYVIGLAAHTFGIVVKSDSRFTSLKDLVDFAKANPGKLLYAGGEYGNTAHLVMEELGVKTAARFRFVSVGGMVEANNALIEGRVMALSNSSGWASQVDSGAFRLLVTFGQRRTRWGAPTAMELGIDIFAYAPFGIVAPKGLELVRTKYLHDAFNRALDDPEYANLLKSLDMVDWYKESDDYVDWAIDQFRFQKTLIETTIGRRRN